MTTNQNKPQDSTTTMGITKRIGTLLIATAAVFAGRAQAAYTTYFGEDLNNSESTPLSATPNSDAARNSFLSKLINVGTETFENQNVGASAPLRLTFPGSNGDVTATLSGGNGRVASVTPGATDGNGRYSVPSTTTRNYWDVAAGIDGAASTFTVTLDRAIAAFGFYGIDIGDFGGQLQLLLFNSAQQQIGSLDVDNAQGTFGSTGGSVLYFGFITQNADELVTSIRFVMTGTGATTDVFAFDNFTVAELAQVAPPDSVPEPATLALTGVALLAAGAARRRRARQG